MKIMFPDFFFFPSSDVLDFNCEVCQLSKHARNSYPISNNKSSFPFSIVYFDVWGLSPTTSLFDFHYFLTFVDDCSRCMWVYLMKTKGEVGAIF